MAWLWYPPHSAFGLRPASGLAEEHGGAAHLLYPVGLAGHCLLSLKPATVDICHLGTRVRKYLGTWVPVLGTLVQKYLGTKVPAT